MTWETSGRKLRPGSETPENAGEPAHEIAPLGAADNSCFADYRGDGELLEANAASCAASAGTTASGRAAAATAAAASTAAGTRTSATSADGGRDLRGEVIGRTERGKCPSGTRSSTTTSRRSGMTPSRSSRVTRTIWSVGRLRGWTIEGHADSRGTNEYNLALGDRRAAAVRDYLASLGVAADRMLGVSRGEETPQCTEEEEACWQRNRRGHFVFTAK